jgi:hypothetical protein
MTAVRAAGSLAVAVAVVAVTAPRPTRAQIDDRPPAPARPIGTAQGPAYVHTGTVDLGVEGITGLTVDPAAGRLYLGSRRGMLWVDLDEPRLKGPTTKLRITGDVEFAPGLDTIFFAVQDAIGMADLRRDPEPVPIGVVDQATDLIFEPTRRELYVFTRTPRVAIFDARSGEGATVIEVPGWYGHSAVATAGRIFFNVGGHQGIYAVDGDSRKVAKWEVQGRLVTPFLMEADPAGRYLFATPARQIVAIDIAAARVVGRVQLPSTPAIAYDAASELLVAAWFDTTPPMKMAAYRVSETGLQQVAEWRAPAGARARLEATRGGFVQHGRNTLGAPVLLLWRRAAG